MFSTAHVMPAIAIGIGSLIALSNLSTIFQSRSDKHVSPVPLVGAMFLAYGLAGFPSTRPYFWAAVILDYGTLVGLIALPWLFYETWLRSERNLEHRFVQHKGDCTVTISLFRNAIAVIKISFDPPKPYGDSGVLTTGPSLSAKWESDANGFAITDFANGSKLVINPEGARFTKSESLTSKDDGLLDSLNCLELEWLPNSRQVGRATVFEIK